VSWSANEDDEPPVVVVVVTPSLVTLVVITPSFVMLDVMAEIVGLFEEAFSVAPQPRKLTAISDAAIFLACSLMSVCMANPLFLLHS